MSTTKPSLAALLAARSLRFEARGLTIWDRVADAEYLPTEADAEGAGFHPAFGIETAEKAAIMVAYLNRQGPKVPPAAETRGRKRVREIIEEGKRPELSADERWSEAVVRRNDVLRHLELDHRMHGQLLATDGTPSGSVPPMVIVPVYTDKASIGVTVDCPSDLRFYKPYRVRRLFRQGADRTRFRSILFETDDQRKAERFVIDLVGGKRPKWLDEELS